LAVVSWSVARIAIALPVIAAVNMVIAVLALPTAVLDVKAVLAQEVHHLLHLLLLHLHLLLPPAHAVVVVLVANVAVNMVIAVLVLPTAVLDVKAVLAQEAAVLLPLLLPRLLLLPPVHKTE